MLGRLVYASLRYRVAVILGAGVLLAAGVWESLRTPLDVFPEFAPPIVEVQVEAPGLSSQAVEQLIVMPLESALNGLPRMTILRSKSVQGLASVQCLFERGADLFQVRQMVSERVGVVAVRLPQLAKAPVVMPPLSSTSRVLHIGLTPKLAQDLKPGEPRLTQTDISVLMKWVIEPRLLAVPGVANVSTYGMTPRQFQVLVKPGDLRDRGVTLAEVKQAARQASLVASGGFHDTPNQRLAIQYATPVTQPADLGKTVVALRQGQPIYLHEVAELTSGNPPFIGEGVINDQPGLFVVVEKFPWGNTLEVTRQVEKAMEIMEPSLPGVQVTKKIFRPASFIELALSNLRHAMLLGCLLVALILLVFLWDWRTALISLTAIPLSIVAAVLVMSRLGLTLNTMVLAGLAIAVGEVVDDAIIDVENIMRRLRLNRAEPRPASVFRVVWLASLEVRSAVVYATFIVAFVCLPIFFLGGVAGSFFRPLAFAYVLSVLASLAVALTVTPALSLWLLPAAARKSHDSFLMRWLHGVYRRVVTPLLQRPLAAIISLVLLLVGAGVVFVLLKEEYLPQFQERDFLMHWVAKPGTGIDELRRDTVLIAREMLRETPVKEFGSHIARAENGEEVYGSNFSELWVSLGDFQGNYAQARRQIEAVMARHPGYEHDLLTYLQERIKEVLSGASATIAIRIFGPDLAELRQLAQEVRQAIAPDDGKPGVPGVVDLKVEAQQLVPQLEVILEPTKLALHGLTPARVMDEVYTLVNGAKVGEVHMQQKVFDLVVWGHPDVRRTLSDLRQLEIEVPVGVLPTAAPAGVPARPGVPPRVTVSLSALGELRQVNAPNSIRHVQASRCIDVTCNVRGGGDLGAAVQEIERRIAPLRRGGYRIELLGEYQARQENQSQLLWLSLVSILGISLMLYMDFRSWRLTLLVLLTLPFALVGGVFSAWVTGGVLSLGSLIGFITVLGIAARNGIMLVSHYRHLELHEGVPFGRELVLRGGAERVGPILMTALAAALGLLPLALSGNQPGYEVEYPMAVVILGGLATSTVLNLLVLPVLYERFGKAPPPEEVESLAELERAAALETPTPKSAFPDKIWE